MLSPCSKCKYVCLAPGDNATIQYEAEPSGDDGEDLPEGVTFFTSYLSFNDVGFENI